MFSLPYSQYIVTREVEDALNLFVYSARRFTSKIAATSTVRVVGLGQGESVRIVRGRGLRSLGSAARRGQRRKSSKCSNESIRADSRPKKCLRHAKDRSNPLQALRFSATGFIGTTIRVRRFSSRACDRCSSRSSGKTLLLDIARKTSKKLGRWPILLHSSGSFIRTSISIARHLAFERWASRRTCSRSVSPSAELPGWIAQWKEQHDDPTTKIQRPRQIYTGPTEGNYIR